MEQETGAQQSTQAPQGAAPSGAPQSAPMDQKQKNMVAGVLAYLWILVIVAYVLGKDDPFTKFHIKQGIVLFILEIIVMVVLGAMPFYGFYMFQPILNLVFIAASIVGIINVVQGKEKELPLIGGLAKHVPI